MSWPLPTSGAAGASYSSTDGYWVKHYYPLASGCIKIDYQNSSSTWTDVTDQILDLGFSGKISTRWERVDRAPHASGGNLVRDSIASQGPTVKTGITTVVCTDPSTYAVIRLARVRDNPSGPAGTGSARLPQVLRLHAALLPARLQKFTGRTSGRTRYSTPAKANSWISMDVRARARIPHWPERCTMSSWTSPIWPSA